MLVTCATADLQHQGLTSPPLTFQLVKFVRLVDIVRLDHLNKNHAMEDSITLMQVEKQYSIVNSAYLDSIAKVRLFLLHQVTVMPVGTVFQAQL